MATDKGCCWFGCAGCLLLLAVAFGVSLWLENQPPPSPLPAPPPLPEGQFTNFGGHLLLLDRKGKLIGIVNQDLSVQHPDDSAPVGRLRTNGKGGWVMTFPGEDIPRLKIHGQLDGPQERGQDRN